MSTNKYKSQLVRLSDMLESTFQEVQYYKKKDNEGQAVREKLITQIDKLKQENQRLLVQRDYLQKISHNHPEANDANPRNKVDHDSSIILNKSKIYMEKINEIIRAITQQLGLKKKNRSTINQHNQTNIINLERSFAKASIGVMKYQQQFMRQAIDKESMRIELDKLRKQNTSLYEMTSNLQQNFAETDRIMKKYNNENKKLLETVQKMQKQNEYLKRQLMDERSMNNRQSSRKRQRPNSQHQPDIDLVYHQRLTEMQEKIRFLQDQVDFMRREKDREHKQKDAFSFRQKSQSSDHQHDQEKKILAQKNQEMTQQIHSLKLELHSCEQKLQKIEKQNKILSMMKQREQALKQRGQKSFPEQEYYQIKIEQLEKEIEKKNEQIQSLLSQVQCSEAEKDKIITVYQNQSHESKDKIIRHQDALMEMDRLIKTLRIKNEQLTKNNKMLGKQCSEKQEQLQGKKQRILNLEQAKIQRQNIIKQLREQLGQKKLMRDLSISDDAQSHQEMVKVMEQNMKRYLGENQKLELELQRMQQKLRDQYAKMNKDLQDLQIQLSDSHKKIDILEADIEHKQHSILELQATIRGINKILNQMTQSWGNQDTEKLLNILNDKLKKQSQYITDLTLYRQKVINQQKSTQINFNQQKNILLYERDTLKQNNLKIIADLIKLFKLKGLSSGDDNWQAIRNSLGETISMMEKERQKIQEFENAWWDKEKNLSQQLQRCKKYIDELQKNMLLLQEERNNFSESSELQSRTNKKNKQLQQQILAISAQYENLKAQVGHKLKTNEKMLQQKDTRNSQLQKINNINVQTISQLQQELNKAKQSISILKSQTAQLEVENKQLLGQIEQLQLQNDQQYQEIQDDNFQLRKDYEQTCLELKEEQNVNASFRDKIKNLTNYIQCINKNSAQAITVLNTQLSQYHQSIKQMLNHQLTQFKCMMVKEFEEKIFQIYEFVLSIEITKNNVEHSINNNVIENLLFGDQSSDNLNIECNSSTEYYNKHLHINENKEKEEKKIEKQYNVEDDGNLLLLNQKINQLDIIKRKEEQNEVEIRKYEEKLSKLQQMINTLEEEKKMSLYLQIQNEKQITTLQQKLMQSQRDRENEKKQLEKKLQQSEREYLNDLERARKQKKKFQEQLRMQQSRIQNFTRRQAQFVQSQQQKIQQLLQESSREIQQKWKSKSKRQTVQILNSSMKAIQQTNEGLFEKLLDKIEGLQHKYANMEHQIYEMKDKIRYKNTNSELKQAKIVESLQYIESLREKNSIIDQLEFSIAKTKKEIQNKQNGHMQQIEELQGKIKQLTIIIEKIEIERSKLSEKFEVALTEAENDNKGVKQRVIQLQNCIRQQEIGHHKQLNFLKTTIQQYEQKQGEMMNQIRQLEMMVVKNTSPKKQTKMEESQKEIKDLRFLQFEKQLQEDEKQIRNLRQMLLDKNQEISLLREQLIAYQDKQEKIANLRAEFKTNSSRRLSFTTTHQQSFTLKADHSVKDQQQVQEGGKIKESEEGEIREDKKRGEENRIKKYCENEQKKNISKDEMKRNQVNIRHGFEQLKAQIQVKQAKLLEKEHYVNQRINILKSIEEKLNQKRIAFQHIPQQSPKHKQSIKVFRPPLERDLPLQINLRQEEKISAGQFSMRSRKQEQVEKQLRISEELREMLEDENKNLKKEIFRKQKQGTKLKQAQKMISNFKKQNEKLNAQLKLKEKIIAKYDLEVRKKSEEIIKMGRNMENLTEQLELERKRNKNFQQLYEKYRMQKRIGVNPVA